MGGIADKNLLKVFEEKTGVKKSAPIRSTLHSMASDKTHSFIDAFETLLPKYKGFIRRTPGDCFFFLTYIVIVMYVSARIALAVLCLFFRVVRFFICCPCRLCRKSGDSAAPKKGK